MVMILARKGRFTFSSRRESLNRMHDLTVHIVDPSSRTASFCADGKLSLATVCNVAVHVHDHVRSQRQATKRAIAHLLLRLRVLYVCRDAQLAARPFPTGQYGADALACVVLVEKRLACQVSRLNLCASQIGGVGSAAVAAWRRVGDATDRQWF